MKDNMIMITFFTMIFGFSIMSVILPDQEISKSERRKLAMRPELIENDKINQDYFKELDQYLIDQFPLRDQFRTLKAYTQQGFFQKLDNNDIFVKENHIFELNKSYSEKSLTTFTNKLKEIRQKYLNEENDIYYGIIPDKIYYLESDIYPKLDYEKLVEIIQTNLPQDFTYIDLFSELALDSYYRTDIHWKQEKIKNVAKKLVESMGKEYQTSQKEEKKYENFYGALYGKSALNIEPDCLTYQTNELLEQIKVWNLETQKLESVYHPEKLDGVDSYDIFLSGATPLLTIENPNQEKKQELIIFRDSFASSLTPLLIESYSKITLIDLRYISTDLLKQYVDFQNSDILFLYSVPVIDSSNILK